MDDKEKKVEFGIKTDGSFDVDGTTFDAPTTAELADAPVEPQPVDPALERLREKAELYDAYEPMLRGIGSGKLTLTEAAPPEPVPPPAEDLAQYFARVQSPRGAVIHEQVKAYAEFLPESQRSALETIPSRYNEVFDKFASASQPAPVNAGPGRNAIEKLLMAKKLRKDAARTEAAGLMRGNRASFPEMGPTGKEVEIRHLKEAIKMHPDDQALATALASYYVGDL